MLEAIVSSMKKIGIARRSNALLILPPIFEVRSNKHLSHHSVCLIHLKLNLKKLALLSSKSSELTDEVLEIKPLPSESTEIETYEIVKVPTVSKMKAEELQQKYPDVKYLHLGLIKIKLVGLFRAGIDTPIISIVQGEKITTNPFDAIIGGVQSNISCQVEAFNLRPNSHVSIQEISLCSRIELKWITRQPGRKLLAIFWESLLAPSSLPFFPVKNKLNEGIVEVFKVKSGQPITSRLENVDNLKINSLWRILLQKTWGKTETSEGEFYASENRLIVHNQHVTRIPRTSISQQSDIGETTSLPGEALECRIISPTNLFLREDENSTHTSDIKTITEVSKGIIYNYLSISVEIKLPEYKNYTLHALLDTGEITSLPGEALERRIISPITLFLREDENSTHTSDCNTLTEVSKEIIYNYLSISVEIRLPEYKNYTLHSLLDTGEITSLPGEVRIISPITLFLRDDENSTHTSDCNTLTEVSKEIIYNYLSISVEIRLPEYKNYTLHSLLDTGEITSLPGEVRIISPINLFLREDENSTHTSDINTITEVSKKIIYNYLSISVEIRLPEYKNYTLHALLDTGATISAIRPEAIPKEYWVEMKKKKSICGVRGKFESTHEIENFPLWIDDINGQIHHIVIKKMIIFPGMNGDIIIGNNVLQHYLPIEISKHNVSFTIKSRMIKVLRQSDIGETRIPSQHVTRIPSTSISQQSDIGETTSLPGEALERRIISPINLSLKEDENSTHTSDIKPITEVSKEIIYNYLSISVEIKLPEYKNFTLHALLDTGATISAIRPEAIPREYWVEMKKEKSICGVRGKFELTHEIENFPLWIEDINGQIHQIVIKKMIILPGMNGDIIIGNDVLQHYLPVEITKHNVSFTIKSCTIKVLRLPWHNKICDNPHFTLEQKVSQHSMVENSHPQKCIILQIKLNC